MQSKKSLLGCQKTGPRGYKSEWGQGCKRHYTAQRVSLLYLHTDIRVSWDRMLTAGGDDPEYGIIQTQPDVKVGEINSRCDRKNNNKWSEWLRRYLDTPAGQSDDCKAAPIFYSQMFGQFLFLFH